MVNKRLVFVCPLFHFKTTKALGVVVPPSLLLRADDVIE
jgi:hypothetical protein